ncbi:hypothetical protein [Saccharothrix sp. Mg75]|uniref:hypothetical protein n=1 Tax=Saccharothrix sp. Mg75 TaxID=3445357 RepID=UPI003EF02CFC
MGIGEPGRSGRHRVEDGAAIWLPVGGELTRTSAPPASLPAQRVRDPLVDTDAVGLRKFNIGLVPASVTPPRTWKRAAWFAVLSSAGVLVGLAIAAAKLVGSVNPVERIGMPGYPTDVPLLTGFPSSSPSTAGTTAAPVPRDQRAPAAGRAGEGLRAAQGDRSPAGAGDPPGGSSGSRTATAVAPAAPSVTTVPGDSAPLVDAETIADRTERFYEEAVRNADTAAAMVSEGFRSTARALAAGRFADVALVEVERISVDPARGVTVSTIRVTREDGTTSTERRELVFTTVGELLIDAERPAGSA